MNAEIGKVLFVSHRVYKVLIDEIQAENIAKIAQRSADLVRVGRYQRRKANTAIGVDQQEGEVLIHTGDSGSAEEAKFVDQFGQLALYDRFQRDHVLRIRFRIQGVEAIQQGQRLIQRLFTAGVHASLSAGDASGKIGLHRISARCPFGLDVSFHLGEGERLIQGAEESLRVSGLDLPPQNLTDRLVHNLAKWGCRTTSATYAGGGGRRDRRRRVADLLGE